MDKRSSTLQIEKALAQAGGESGAEGSNDGHIQPHDVPREKRSRTVLMEAAEAKKMAIFTRSDGTPVAAELSLRCS